MRVHNYKDVPPGIEYLNKLSRKEPKTTVEACRRFPIGRQLPQDLGLMFAALNADPITINSWLILSGCIPLSNSQQMWC